jgi:hypothetical protein
MMEYHGLLAAYIMQQCWVIMIVSDENISMLAWLLVKWHAILCLTGIFTMSNLFLLICQQEVNCCV